MQAKGIEAQISRAIINFEKEFMGRGPNETHIHIWNDMIIVRLKGVLTPAEHQLSRTVQGQELVKQVRARLIEQARESLMSMVQLITGKKVVSMYSDISTEVGERVIVFTLDQLLDDTSE